MSSGYSARLPDYEFYKSEIKCLYGCPVYTDAKGYVVAVSKGKYKEGYAIAREPNPFASICGMVCAAPCESACRKGDVDRKPIMIRAMKGFLTEKYGVESENREVLNNILKGQNEYGLKGEFDLRTLKEFAGTKGVLDSKIKRTGKRIAIIGSGCAGMTAAHDLTILGYQVVVFEAESIPGGMLTQGVPIFRLSRNMTEAEIDSILEMGVELRLNTRIGKDLTIDELFEDGFGSVLLATGLQVGRKLDIPGADLEGILIGISFLRENNIRGEINIGKKVIVIGGGDVAMDCARVSLRGGADSVKIVCLEDWDGMRAAEFERYEAIDEGIEIINNYGPQKFLAKKDQLTGIEIKKVVSLFGKDGRFNPTFESGSERILEADSVILAIGQVADLGFIKGDDTIKITPSKTIAVEPERLATSRKGVFACGDIATGPKLFIDAVKQGHIAARSIHEFLSGEKFAVRKKGEMEEIPSFYTVDRSPYKFKRPDTIDPKHRSTTSHVVESGYSDDEAVIQGKRCLVCSINVIMRGNRCIACNGCVDACPENCLKLINLDDLDTDERLAQVIGSLFEIPLENIVLGSHYPHNLEKGMAMLFDPTKCIRCGLCLHYCPTFAITMEKYSYNESLEIEQN